MEERNRSGFILPSKDRTEIKTVNASNSFITKTANFNNCYAEKAYEKLLTDLSEFQDRDAGWALHKIMNLKINFNC